MIALLALYCQNALADVQTDKVSDNPQSYYRYVSQEYKNFTLDLGLREFDSDREQQKPSDEQNSILARIIFRF